MADIVKIINTIHSNATSTYQERVPVATKTNIIEVGNPILNYADTKNEFLDAIVNKIAMTVVTGKIASNPLAVLKKGTVPLGKDIEEIFTNMAKAKSYNAEGSNLLNREIPDVKSAYYRMNRQDMYKVTISDLQLKMAFTSWENMDKLVTDIINSLYSGDNFDEFILMKNLMGDAIKKNIVKKQECVLPINEQTAKDFVKTAKGISLAMTFASSTFNTYKDLNPTDTKPVVTWTPVEDQIIILRSDVATEVDVEVLAKAFNIDNTKFLSQVLVIDAFVGEGGDKVLGMICDKSFFQVWENQQTMESFRNGEGLYTNYMWHHWQTYAVSPFANAVALTVA